MRRVLTVLVGLMLLVTVAGCDKRETACVKAGGHVERDGDWHICYGEDGQETSRWINVNR